MNEKLGLVIKPFLDAGFRVIEKQYCLSNWAALGLQKKIEDEIGIRYFLTVHVYDNSEFLCNSIDFALKSYFQSKMLNREVDISTPVNGLEESLKIQEELFVTLQGEYYETK